MAWVKHKPYIINEYGFKESITYLGDSESEVYIKQKDGTGMFAKYDWANREIIVSGTPIEGFTEYPGGSFEEMFMLDSQTIRATTSVKTINPPIVMPESIHALFSNLGAEELDLSLWDASNVTDMGRLFDNAWIKKVDLSSWHPKKPLVDVAGMFSQCVFLEEVVGLNNFDVSEVTYFSNLFTECSDLEIIDISSWKTPKMRYFYAAFYRCLRLRHIYVGEGWDLSGLDLVSDSYIDMFTGCSSLHNWDSNTPEEERYKYAVIDNGTNKGYFEMKLKPEGPGFWISFDKEDDAVVISSTAKPESAWYSGDWHTRGKSLVEVYENEFGLDQDHIAMLNATKVKSVDTPIVWPAVCDGALNWRLNDIDTTGWDFSRVESCKNFINNYTGEVLDLSTLDVSSVKNAESMLSNNKSKTLVLGSLDFSGLESCQKMFSNSSYEHIYVNQDFKLNTDAIDWYAPDLTPTAFTGCDNLHNFDSSALSIKRAFISKGNNGGYLELLNQPEMCIWMDYDEDSQTLTLSGKEVQGWVEYRGEGGLADCFEEDPYKVLEASKIVSINTPLVWPDNIDWAFNGFENLSELDTTGWDFSNVMSCSYVFNNMGIEVLDLSSLDFSNAMSFDQMISGNLNLTEIYLGKINMKNAEYCEYMFGNNPNLEHIYVEQPYKIGSKYEAYTMFEGDEKLHNFDPDKLGSDMAIIDDGSNGGYLEVK